MSLTKILKRFSDKIKIFIYVTGLLILTSCIKTGQVKIRGALKNSKSQTLYFEKVDVFKVKTIDSVILKNNGRFSFSTTAKLPDFYQLRLSNNKIISFLLEPEEKAVISADISRLDKTLEIKGSEDSELLNELLMNLEKTKSKLDSLSEIYINTADETLKADLTAQYKEIIDQHRKYSISFILDNCTSLVSITALYQEIEPGIILFGTTRDIQFFKIVTDSLIRRYPRSNHVMVLKVNTNRLLQGYTNQKILSLAEPDNYILPEIALPDIKGDTLNLSSFKGNYVLLSFWASWNKASINANLKLKDVYEKYHKKGFEVYQVSFDKSVKQWHYTVRFDQLPWINVNDSSFPNSEVARYYNVSNLPCNYLIDKSMVTILGKNLTSNELDKKLSELLN